MARAAVAMRAATTCRSDPLLGADVEILGDVERQSDGVTEVGVCVGRSAPDRLGHRHGGRGAAADGELAGIAELLHDARDPVDRLERLGDDLRRVLQAGSVALQDVPHVAEVRCYGRGGIVDLVRHGA